LCESEALARLLARNAAVRRMGKVSGAWMRSCGLRRMRRLGNAGSQVRFAAIACDLRRTISLLHGSAARRRTRPPRSRPPSRLKAKRTLTAVLGAQLS
jgi:hypothetical protein